jgi:pimeloyl-ACP methyl ester carboxylesterase
LRYRIYIFKLGLFMADLFAEIDRGGRSSELVVIFHGFGTSPKKMEGLRQAVRCTRPNADIYVRRMPYAGLRSYWCTVPLEEICGAVVREIDDLWNERKGQSKVGYRRILLVGHSMGSVVARRIAILAYGENRDASFESCLKDFVGPRAWANAVNRLVLVAGMNGGWSITSTLDWFDTVRWGFGQLVGEIVFCGRLTILGIRKGAPFLSQTRLQWLALMRRRRPPKIIVVQLLGTIDDLVGPGDVVDYAIDCETNNTFFYLEMGHTGHHDAVEMRAPGRGKAKKPIKQPKQRAIQFSDEQIQAARWKKFCMALNDGVRVLKENSIPHSYMSDSLPPSPQKHVTDVVMVIHGIRDRGFWTQKVARVIKEQAGKRRHQFQSFSLSYGYFAMLPFIWPWVRQRKVEWLMNHYVELRAQYPRAQFSYVGHSNGTYLAAHALQKYRAVRFKRIVFAGSVVRRDYDWRELVKPKSENSRQRVWKILNFVATGDWVVALFPKALQPFRIFDVGSAGYDGFDQGARAGVREVKFIKGRHSAGHEERHWKDIAAFIINGNVSGKEASAQSAPLREASHYSTLIVAAGAILIVGFGCMLTISILGRVCVPALSASFPGLCIGVSEPTALSASVRAFIAMLYWWAVYIFVTRV